jgi:hypothetical protein
MPLRARWTLGLRGYGCVMVGVVFDSPVALPSVSRKRWHQLEFHLEFHEVPLKTHLWVMRVHAG